MRRSFTPYTPASAGEESSPLEQVEEAFDGLATAVRPLTLPGSVVSGQAEESDWPVDRVRAQLAHPGTGADQRAQIWREVAGRALESGDPWRLVAVGMSVPALRRMLRRQHIPRHLERAEVEQTALAAVATALPQLTAGHIEPHRVLFNAADRDVHRLIYAAHQESRVWSALSSESAEHASTGYEVEGYALDAGEVGDEYSVLAEAVQAGVLKPGEAQLIALTRLEGRSVKDVAKQREVSWRTLYRYRTVAEDHLTRYLRRKACAV
ncbi:hypothetical protein ABZ820_10850 [Streptomyces diacarni]|uniref:hypothetical protein n=1 Tax=Streptomyces diacarni TaxID=2800381 RepID=UPI0033E25A34